MTELRGRTEAGLDRRVVERVFDRVLARKSDWVDLVERLASLESPTTEPTTQEPVMEVMGQRLRALGFRVRRFRGTASGGFLLATPLRRGANGSQLVLGHCDTVWPVGTLAAMPVERHGSRLIGPGVFDMKGGLAHIPIALEALAELDLEPKLAPVIFMNSDEEIGSPESTKHIRRIARRVHRAFVLEPALGLDGALKTARKGTGRFTVRIFGKEAHAGLDPERGASAIQELALVVQELHALSDPERGVVVNVGEIRGGLRANVIASEARAEVDVRVASKEAGRQVEERILALESRVPGCRLEIRGGMDRPPLEPTAGNRALWTKARNLAEVVGVTLSQGLAGGASDGNTTSQVTPTLDGLGAVGDGAHARHEYLEIDRSVERCALFACLLMMPCTSRFGTRGGSS